MGYWQRRNRWRGFLIHPIGSCPYYTDWVWQNVIHYLRVSMIEKVEQMSLQFHNDSRIGDAIFRINQDSNQINVALREVIVNPLMTFYRVSIAVAFVVAFDPLLAGGILLVAIPMVMLTVFFTPRIRRRSVVNRVSNSNLTSRLQETFTAMKLIKANRAGALVLGEVYQSTTQLGTGRARVAPAGPAGRTAA